METTRRGFMASMLAACAAPAIVKAEILMPVRSIIVPPYIGMDFGVCELQGFRIIESTTAERIARMKAEILAHCEPAEVLGLGWGPRGYTALVHPSNVELFNEIKFRRRALPWA